MGNKKSLALSKLAAVLVLPILFAACGKQTFDKPQYKASYTANQYTTIKPKVDIVMFQDTSSSMLVPMNTLKGQLASFLSSIDGNWDFHFAVLPLQANADLRNRWIVASDCTGITYCLTPAQVGFYDNGSGWYTPDANTSSVDYGFQFMQANLSNSGSMVGSGFLRSDAMLVVIPFTNGNDTTGMSYPGDYYDRGDGQMVPNFNGAAATNSYNSFYSFISNFKSSISQMSFYSVAGGNKDTNPDYSYSCYGGTAWPGTRYHRVAYNIDQAYTGAINGGQFDICSNQLGTVLSSIATRMQDTVLAIEFNYIVLPERAVTSSIKIYKNGSEITNNALNGWTLYNVVNGVHQYTSNMATSYAPYSGNFKSGYFIQLNGSARFKGSDTISITYDKQ